MASEAEAAVTDTVPDQFDPCWVIFWNETVTSPDEKKLPSVTLGRSTEPVVVPLLIRFSISCVRSVEPFRSRRSSRHSNASPPLPGRNPLDRRRDEPFGDDLFPPPSDRHLLVLPLCSSPGRELNLDILSSPLCGGTAAGVARRE
jgi:hypothetical protein